MPDTGLTRFVILAAPRTGSNMLCTMLNSHPDILCHHEVFNPRDIFYALPLRESDFNLGNVQQRDADPVGFMQRLWQNPLGHACTGFKMTHWQNPAALDAIIEDTGIKKIILRRNNRIKTHVSRLIAEQRDVWEYYADDCELIPVKVTLDPDELHRDIELNNQYYAELDTRLSQPGQQVCPVAYETLRSPQTQQQLLHFLGLDFHRLQVASRKQNSDDLRLLVKNFDQLTVQLDDAQLVKELWA